MQSAGRFRVLTNCRHLVALLCVICLSRPDPASPRLIPSHPIEMEPITGLEPVTSSLPRTRSTAELYGLSLPSEGPFPAGVLHENEPPGGAPFSPWFRDSTRCPKGKVSAQSERHPSSLPLAVKNKFRAFRELLQRPISLHRQRGRGRRKTGKPENRNHRSVLDPDRVRVEGARIGNIRDDIGVLVGVVGFGAKARG